MPELNRPRKRSLASAAGVAVLLTSVAVAQGAVRSGGYKGKTVKGSPISFKVTKGKRGRGKAISRFVFSRVTLACSDDRPVVTEGKFSSGRKRLPITRSGRFAVVVRYMNGGRWTARGRVRGRRATGTLRVKVRYNGDDKPTPRGSIRCDSGKLRFKARRR